MRKLVPLLVCLVVCLSAWTVSNAQLVGDHYTAGFVSSRTYLNSDVQNLKPPLQLFKTISLVGVTGADSVTAFAGHVLVGEGIPDIKYSLFNAITDALVWQVALTGVAGGGNYTPARLNYIPAFANGVVILGGETTTTIKAVRAIDGAVLWQDAVGSAAGRYPIVTDNVATYHGRTGFASRDAVTGAAFWQNAVTTAEAPLSVWGNRVYILMGNGDLQAYSPNGNLVWTAPGASSNGANFVAGERLVLIDHPAGNAVTALSTTTGAPAWPAPLALPGLSRTPGIALAYDRLITFQNDTGSGQARVATYDPDTGALLWQVTEPAAGAEYGVIANNVIYYYNVAANRIRARDAATGDLLWSINKAGVRGLSVADDSLLVLYATTLEIYRFSAEIYMAHLAHGQGFTTLMTIANATATAANAVVRFRRSDGTPLVVPVQGVGNVSEVNLVVPAGASARVQTVDLGEAIAVGWTEIGSDQLIRGSCIFQYSTAGDIVAEAGVGDASATGRAGVYVSRGGVYNTGAAVANPSDEAAQVTFRLLDSTGALLASFTLTPALAPGAQIARFIDELFPGLFPPGDTTPFEGTLVIESPVPVTTTALRTKGGFQLSSVPVGQVVK